MITVQEGIHTMAIYGWNMLHNQGFHEGAGILRKELHTELETAAGTLSNSTTAGVASSHSSFV